LAQASNGRERIDRIRRAHIVLGSGSMNCGPVDAASRKSSSSFLVFFCFSLRWRMFATRLEAV